MSPTSFYHSICVHFQHPILRLSRPPRGSALDNAITIGAEIGRLFGSTVHTYNVPYSTPYMPHQNKAALARSCMEGHAEALVDLQCWRPRSLALPALQIGGARLWGPLIEVLGSRRSLSIRGYP